MHLCFWFLPSHRYHARRFPSATAPCPQLWRHIGDLNLACVATLGGAASRRTSGRAVVPAGLPAVGFECPFFRHKPHSTSYIDCWLFGSNTCSELEMETWKSVQALNLDKSKLYTYIVRSIFSLEGQTLRLGPAVYPGLLPWSGKPTTPISSMLCFGRCLRWDAPRSGPHWIYPALLLPYIWWGIFGGYTAETRGPFFWGLGIDHTTHNLDWDCKPCGGLVAFDFSYSSIFSRQNWNAQEFGAVEFYAGNGNVSKCFNASGIRCAALDILFPIDGSDGRRSNPMGS